MNQRKKFSPREIFLTLLCIVFFITSSLLAIEKFAPNLSPLDFGARQQIKDIIKSEFIGDYPSDRAIYEGEMKGFVYATGDPYSAYFPKREAEAFDDSLNERYAGIGVRFDYDKDETEFWIDEVFSNSPAEIAGVQSGDHLLEVDGQSVHVFDGFSQIGEAIRGEAGTQVDLKFERGGEMLDFQITRGFVEMDLVTVDFEEEVAVVRILSFGNEMDPEMQRVILQILENSDVNKIILDLRSNTGGVLDESINVASYFLDPDLVVVREEGKDYVEETKTSLKQYGLQDYQTVVLVDGVSASASEILAGALRDHRGLPLIGQTTYGKGLVQKLYQLKDGGQLKLTVAEWFTPNGSEINEVGLDPDIRIGVTKDVLQEVLEKYNWETGEMSLNHSANSENEQ